MKKFIAFLLVLAVVGGIAFLGLGNDMFMLAMITKNETKAANAISEELGGYQNWRNYDLTITETAYDEADDSLMENTVHLTISISADGQEKTFVAKQTFREKDGETSDVTTETEYYFSEGVLYINNLTAESKTQKNSSYTSALEDFVYAPEVVFFSSFDVLEDFTDFRFAAQPDFSFSPFFVGQKFVYTNSLATVNFNYTFHFDLLRNYRGVTVSMTDSDNQTGQEFSVLVNNSQNKPVTVTLPSDLSTYAPAI